MDHLLNALIAAAIALGSYIFVDAYAGDLEGRFFPVVTDVEFSSVTPAGNRSSRIEGSFYKPRGGCDFVGIDFFLGGVNRSIPVDLVFEDGSKERGQGYEEFGPWVVQLSEGQFNNRSFAIVRHRCHPFWITETLFYK